MLVNVVANSLLSYIVCCNSSASHMMHGSPSEVSFAVTNCGCQKCLAIGRSFSPSQPSRHVEAVKWFYLFSSAEFLVRYYPPLLRCPVSVRIFQTVSKVNEWVGFRQPASSISHC